VRDLIFNKAETATNYFQNEGCPKKHARLKNDWSIYRRLERNVPVKEGDRERQWAIRVTWGSYRISTKKGKGLKGVTEDTGDQDKVKAIQKVRTLW